MKKLLSIKDFKNIVRKTQGQIEKSARARAKAPVCPARRGYIRVRMQRDRMDDAYICVGEALTVNS
ncbi:hypothetical protein [Phocaeicola salanitronis]|uniref:hypothetical protein n=1 Tax=Phocaeicola salanitronis TaxID=376805 RepID=UPI0023F80C9D|nr:hypothetical protein [Phocaeicola salanitronis]